MAVPVEELAKLVPLLGSSSDGEVLAAVRAIERKLKRDGHDWHDLARVLQGRIIDQPSPRDSFAEYAAQRGRPAWAQSDMERQHLDDLMEAIRRYEKNPFFK